MPDYTRYFKPFIESGKIKDLKEALSHCDDEWSVQIVDSLFGSNYKLRDVDVSYSSETIQIQIKEMK